jgi:hypothetical protein
MIRIEITTAAYEALAASATRGLLEPHSEEATAAI